MIDDLSASVPDALCRSREVLIIIVTISFSEIQLETPIKWSGVTKRFLRSSVQSIAVCEKHSSSGVCLEADRRQMRAFYSPGFNLCVVVACGMSQEGSVLWCYPVYLRWPILHSALWDCGYSVKWKKVVINVFLRDQETIKELFVITQLLFC